MFRLTLRARLTLVAAVAVALAVVTASLVVFFVVRGQLLGQVDSALRTRAAEISSGQLHLEPGPLGQRLYLDVGPGPVFAGLAYIQAVRTDGTVFKTFREGGNLAPDRHVLAVAQGRSGAYFANSNIAGIGEVRVRTVPLPNGYALQVARSLDEVNHTLHRITLLLIVIALGGILLAAGLGLTVARAALVPVRRLTAATEHVTRTGDLSERIPTGGQDELARLAGSFNTMLAALEESIRAQRQLVADASHELRTPLTSLRTNIEVLLREGTALEQADRQHLLDDVLEQLGEMTTLIGQLIQLAAGDAQKMDLEELRFDVLVWEAVERARRNTPSVAIEARLEPTLVFGSRDALERAVGNLLDNASKWSPVGSPVVVALDEGELTIRDHGPGISREDLPHVFERFYRSRTARGLPGSGLGLAIVKQVVESHGGTVGAERASGGGTLIRVRLPKLSIERINRDASRVQRLTFPQSTKSSAPQAKGPDGQWIG